MDSTSRICVKGLPKRLTEERLREHFSERGEVTDAKIIKARDGVSRQFGFVGFRTADDAQAALKYFNRSFIDTSRITVELAEKIGSNQLARPWSKYSTGSSANTKLHQDSATAEPEAKETARAAIKAKRAARRGPEEDDPKLAEFLDLMKPRSKGALWANDDPAAAPSATKQPQQQPGSEARQPKRKRAAIEADATVAAAEEEGVEDDEADLYEDLPAQGPATTAPVVAGRHLAQLRQAAARAAAADAGQGDGGDSSDEDVGQEEGEEMTDMDYLRSRMRSTIRDSDEETSSQEGGDAADGDSSGTSQSSSSTEHGHLEGDSGAETASAEGQQQGVAIVEAPDADGEAEQLIERRQSHAEASTQDTGRLFLRNLPFSATEAEISDLFAPHGDLQEVHLVMDRVTRNSRGIAYVQFVKPRDAVAAQAALDSSSFQGRLLHVLPASQRPEAPKPELEEGANTAKGPGGFKAQREAQQRAQAGDRAAWSTLFMRSDTVAAAVAEHYGITKAQLLDKEASDLPVRMALGETHVIALTKRKLGDAGVSVEALEAAAAASGKASATSSVPRSGTALLVKNLPYTADEGELAELFGKCGPLTRLVLPLTRTLAIVEFQEPQDARRAFKALAFKRYQHVPVYLEWAPKDIFRPDAPKPALLGLHATGAISPGSSAQPSEAAVVAQLTPDAEDADTSTIFVKNLAFSTGNEALQKHFDSAVAAVGGQLRSAKVATRKGADGKPLSMGFGFVECSSESVAAAVIKKLQGSKLDKHQLVLQLSKHKASSAPSQKASKEEAAKQSTKLIVRNIAFEATRKDVMSLFSPFGHIKTCRLPRKFDGTPRGFAFLEFVTKQEAKVAMDSVSGAHLYGRRLVIEWAQQGEDGLDDIRAKTAAKFRGEGVAEFDELPVVKKQKRMM